MIAPGQKIDLHFRLQLVRDGIAKEMAFGDLLTRPTIVSVYMKNHTPSCDRQNDSLVEHAADFERAGVNLVALSRDTCGSHLRYARARKIPYILASDPKDAFARAADSMVEKTMYGRTFIGPARAAFLFDRDGTLLAIAPKVDTASHGAQLKGLLAGLRLGGGTAAGRSDAV